MIDTNKELNDLFHFFQDTYEDMDLLEDDREELLDEQG